jgi:hypothetical protein
MTDTVKHYIWKEGETEFAPTSADAKDLETRFPGIRYSSCDGLNNKGKRTNIHTESYADSDELRVWQGETVTREPTTITLSLYFIGENRQVIYEEFYQYISNGKVYYWDNVRKKQAYMILEDELKIREDVYKGSTPYISVDFKFQNIWGACKDVETF